METGLTADLVHGGLESFGALFSVKERRDGDRTEFTLGDVPEFGQFFVGQDWGLQFDQVATRWIRIQQIAFWADRRDGGGDDFFADTIDRRIGDLREKLFEIIVEELRFIRQDGERDVGTHRAHGFDAVFGHRDEQFALVFEGVAKG